MKNYIVVEQHGQVRLINPGPFEEYIEAIAEEWNKSDVIAIIRISRNVAYAIESIEDGIIEWTKVKP